MSIRLIGKRSKLGWSMIGISLAPIVVLFCVGVWVEYFDDRWDSFWNSPVPGVLLIAALVELPLMSYGISQLKNPHFFAADESGFEYRDQLGRRRAMSWSDVEAIEITRAPRSLAPVAIVSHRMRASVVVVPLHGVPISLSGLTEQLRECLPSDFRGVLSSPFVV